MSNQAVQLNYHNFATLKAFIQATRPRTFPLAIASIVCGSGLALSQLASSTGITWHNWLVMLLTFWVALALQILSNLANDYGDGVKGTDALRDDNSPERMLAKGYLQPNQFIHLIYGWAFLTFCSGVALIAIGFDSLYDFLLFLGFGIVAIIAAMAYTMGKRPYGYWAMGEAAVLIFFGWLAVLGTVYLQTQQFQLSHLLPATGCGGLAACVLYVNNMRDFYSDKQAGKVTLAILVGESRMQLVYGLLLITSFLCYLLYAVNFNWYSLSVLLVYPLAYQHISVIHKARFRHVCDNNQKSLSFNETVDTAQTTVSYTAKPFKKETVIDTVLIGKQLKAIVMITLVTNLLFVIGIAVSHWA